MSNDRPFQPSDNHGLLRRLDQICDAFELQWRADRRPRIEEYLANLPASQHASLLSELIPLDFDYRRLAGEQPAEEDYLGRFPAVDAAWLRELAAAARRGEITAVGESQFNSRLDAYQQSPASAAPQGPLAARPALEQAIHSLAELKRRLEASGLLTSAQLADLSACLDVESAPNWLEVWRDELLRRHWLNEFQWTRVGQDPAPSLVVGQYSIVGRIGAGGMGIVYQAVHRSMDRIVALKMLNGELHEGADGFARFQREVRLIAQLSHPNIVTAFDAGRHRGRPYLAMEFIEGENLESLVLGQGPLPAEDAVRVILQAAEALQYAHESGVIHRDVKPANLMIDSQRRVKLLDLGLSRLCSPDATAENQAARLTRSTIIMGTPEYMAPEQARDAISADHRIDVYSLGRTLYFLLLGRRVFARLAWFVGGEPREEASIPRDLRIILEKMTAASADDRLASMREVSDHLKQWLAPKPEIVTTAIPAAPRARAAPPRALFPPDPAATSAANSSGANMDFAVAPRVQTHPRWPSAKRPRGNRRSPKSQRRMKSRWSMVAWFVGIAGLFYLGILWANPSARVRSPAPTHSAAQSPAFSPAFSPVASPTNSTTPDNIDDVVESSAAPRATPSQSPGGAGDESATLVAGEPGQAASGDSSTLRTGRRGRRAADRANDLPEIPLAPSSPVTSPPLSPPAPRVVSAADAAGYQREWSAGLGRPLQNTNLSGMTLVLIPAGEFSMGTARDVAQTLVSSFGNVREASSVRAEMPSHLVRLSQPFYMGQTEVTVGQFRQFARDARYQTVAEREGLGWGLKDGQWTNGPEYCWRDLGEQNVADDMPVVNIHWADASAFCRWLSRREQAAYRLPTEAEWEYACRAGSDAAWHFGDKSDELADFAWGESNAKGRLRPVATRRPNAFGLHDMLGNAGEWCQDFFAANYYRESPPQDPTGPSEGQARVQRGGNVNGRGVDLRSAARKGQRKADWECCGFRVVRGL